MLFLFNIGHCKEGLQGTVSWLLCLSNIITTSSDPARHSWGLDSNIRMRRWSTL